MNTVCVVKLANGEDVIGRLMHEDDEKLYLADVLSLFYRMNDASTGPIVYMSKYCMYSVSYDVTFLKKDILTVHTDLVPHVCEYFEELLANSKSNLSFVKKKVEEKDLWSKLYTPTSNTEIH